MKTDFKVISERREEARQEMVRDIHLKWASADLHINQVHRRTGIGYTRLRQFLTKAADNLTDAELLTLHSSIR